MSRSAVPSIAAALLSLVLAGCSGPGGAPNQPPVESPVSTVPSARAPSLPPVASLRPETPAATESTACLAPRDPVAAPEAAWIAATIPLGCEGGAVAVGGGSVWVVPHLDPVLLRIDPTTNTVVDRISLGDRGPGAEIDATDSAVWASVSSPSFDFERLVRIEPSTGGVVASVDVPGGFPAIGKDAVWASGPAGIYRIDPDTNTVAAMINAGDCWVVTLDRRAICAGPEGVITVDPATDRITRLPGEPLPGRPIVALDGLVWGVDGTSLWAVDPKTGRQRADLRPPHGAESWALDGVVLDGALWATASSVRDTGANRLVRIDRDALRIDCVIETPDQEFGIAAGFGSVWFSFLRQPWLIRVDPAC